MYLNSIDEFAQEKADVSNQHKIALSIVETFIHVDSKRELNVDMVARNSVITRVAEASTDLLLPHNTFDPVTKIIFRELKEDAFPRYIRGDSFKKFALLKGEKFVKEIALDLRIVGIRNAVLFQPKDFNSPCITDRDIQFMFRLMEGESDWKNVYDMIDHSAYVSKTCYSIGGMQGLRLWKCVGYLPCNLETAEEIELDMTRDSQMREFLGLHKIIAGENNNYPYSMGCYRYTVDMGPMLQRRVFDLIAAPGYDTERQCVFHIGKTSTMYSDLLPPSKKKKIVKSQLFYGNAFFKVSDTRTRYVQIMYTNPNFKIDMGEKMSSYIAKVRCRDNHKIYLKLLASTTSNAKLDAVRELIQDFRQRYILDKDSVKTWSTVN